MENQGGDAERRASVARPTPRALAFYLPQFHPIPENDAWWGNGFTEWNNVARARPLFPGHYQPHVPGELGYYDLRVPEVREAQAELARSHGISGFVYYHYWFHGKRLLERPFDEVLASGSPDFPFALCWANEEWTRNWDSKTGHVLMPQKFSEEDDRAHIRWLVNVFADDRYIKIDGRPLMLIYRPARIPNMKRTAEIWREEATRAGFPDLYLCWVEGWGRPPGGPETFGMDATVGFMLPLDEHVHLPVEGARGHRILDYEASVREIMRRPAPPWKRFPSVMVGWDNTARRALAATLFVGATPEAYRSWLEETVASVADVRAEENYLFIVAWNEWAEGNHLEPDQRFGRAFLEATRAVLLDPSPPRRPSTITPVGSPSEAALNAARLVRELVLDPTSILIGVGSGADDVSRTLEDMPLRPLVPEHEVPESNQDAMTRLASATSDDLETLPAALEEVDDVGALVMLGMIDRLDQPQRLLSRLSSWALKQERPLVVVSVPNASHFDNGFRLLGGRWAPGQEPPSDHLPLRFFTQSTLRRLVERCGWQVIGEGNVESVRSRHYDADLTDAVPGEMVGALRTLAECTNPDMAVEEFVWALRAVPVADPPATFADAIAPGGDDAPQDPLEGGSTQPLYDYLSAAGLITSEQSRRNPPRPLVPKWKRKVLDRVNRSRRATAVVQKVHGWIR